MYYVNNKYGLTLYISDIFVEDKTSKNVVNKN